ncbi:hypothetical protein QAD02_006572 [Eretmocerus hayati]|uniref:Uncharacterized protein n=1 Tax=Eretmocerus hayati TaxID=131215 RepID=A0ACC2N187_9HYME|nr:hypothetical protein QAD02_006572 [Eretmocerus hayati]
MLYSTIKLYILAITLARTNSFLIPNVSSFSKELNYLDEEAVLSTSQQLVTSGESYLYAICESQGKYVKFNKCNVTIETPAFPNATFREVCHVDVLLSNPNDFTTKLKLYPMEDDKVLLSWIIKDHDYKTKQTIIRILHMFDCSHTDVSIPAETIITLIPYETAFDVIFINNTLCGSDYCTLHFSEDGKKISGPSKFMPNIKISYVVAIEPVTENSPAKGFYVLGQHKKEIPDSFLVAQVTPDGSKAIEILKSKGYDMIKSSNAHELYSICWSMQRTKITCKQYDVKGSLKMSTVVEFLDEPHADHVRWLQQHNLQGGGLLLVTGKAIHENRQLFDSYSIIKIRPDGRRERPLEIDGLGFKCYTISKLTVDVAESDHEICVHFACERSEHGSHGIESRLKFSSRCLPKEFVSLAKRKPSSLN